MPRKLLIFIVLSTFLPSVFGAENDSMPMVTPAVASPAIAETISQVAAGDGIVFHALALIGVDYKRGGKLPVTGFDCSGLVRYVFRQAQGVELPNTARDQSKLGANVKRDALQPGDLVFYNTLRRTFSHVGIYLGENRFIHAPSTGGEVRIDDMTSPYWAKRFNGARRITGITGLTAAPSQVNLQQ
jgi:cell wall-associated NlpC family hydrolase